MKNDHHDHGPKVVPVTFILEDPEGLTEADQVEWRVMAAVGENILEVAIDHDIHMEHTCGGVCACKGPGRFRFGSPRGIATPSRKFHTSPSTGR